LTDNWSTYDFLVPGILLMWTGSFEPGTAQTCNYSRPDYPQAIGGVTFTSQAVTPTSDRTARYFFSWGPHVRHGDEAMRDLLMGIAGKAFAEDKTIIEAQQRVIDLTPNPQFMPTAHDRGVTLFNRLVSRLVGEESESNISPEAPLESAEVE
jgi:vanillate O-demethylase monooxygenase subunit